MRRRCTPSWGCPSRPTGTTAGTSAGAGKKWAWATAPTTPPTVPPVLRSEDGDGAGGKDGQGGVWGSAFVRWAAGSRIWPTSSTPGPEPVDDLG